MSLSDFAENKLLDHIVGGTAWQPTSPLYLALTTVAVTDADTGSTITEAAYTGYARTAVAASAWAAAALGEKHNTDQILIPTCTGGSATVIGFALCTTPTGGEIVAYGPVPSTPITTDSTPEFAPGALSLTFD